LSAINEKT